MNYSECSFGKDEIRRGEFELPHSTDDCRTSEERSDLEKDLQKARERTRMVLESIRWEQQHFMCRYW